MQRAAIALLAAITALLAWIGWELHGLRAESNNHPGFYDDRQRAERTERLLEEIRDATRDTYREALRRR